MAFWDFKSTATCPENVVPELGVVTTALDQPMFGFVGKSSGLGVVVVNEAGESQFKLASATGVCISGAVAMVVKNVKVSAGV